MKKRKVLIAAALGLILAGLAVISYTLASSGALEGINEKYNIFDMVDDSLETMQDMNAVMGKVKSNVATLDGKLDLLGETNELLEEQLEVVDELNLLMAGQKPLLEETNTSISTLESKLHTTLELAQGLNPLMDGLISAMNESVGVTSQVVDGSAEMVGVASYISTLFDATLGYLGRIQPHSSKAKAYMEGDILSRIFDFVPRQNGGAGAARDAVQQEGDGGGEPSSNPVADVVEGTREVVDGVAENLLNPLLDPVLDLLNTD